MDYRSFYQLLNHTPLKRWKDRIRLTIDERLSGKNRHGDYPTWKATIEQLPEIKPSFIDLKAEAVTIGGKADIDDEIRKQLHQSLKQLHPWRKGPYRLFDIYIDTEWRSDWKWQRLQNHIDPLQDRTVLDVGSGNGYHCWRMAGAGAGLVIGIDPYLLSVMQFHVFQNYIRKPAVQVLPLALEDMPEQLPVFDTVFSMGVLYHRRSPMHHLLHLRNLLREGGQLVLETLVINGDDRTVLLPEERYAKMRNVWFIPSTEALQRWLLRCGFKDIKCIDITRTSTEEQRSTEWMHFESLADHLKPGDQTRTVEGLPAPTRGLILANR